MMRVTIEGDLGQVREACGAIAAPEPSIPRPVRRRRRQRSEEREKLWQRRATIGKAYRALVRAGRQQEELARRFVQALTGKIEITDALVDEAKAAIGGAQ